VLRACPQCRQFYKPEEPRCPHCGREPSWKTVMAGVAAAALLVCDTIGATPIEFRARDG